MWGWLESFLGRPETHDSGRFPAVVKMLAFYLVATIATDQLQSRWLLSKHHALLLGLVIAVCVDQAIPPRATPARFLLVLVLLIPISYLLDAISMIGRAW